SPLPSSALLFLSSGVAGRWDPVTSRPSGCDVAVRFSCAWGQWQQRGPPGYKCCRLAVAPVAWGKLKQTMDSVIESANSSKTKTDF
ncbi:unnamed protein product, partial [Arctogadus glacialis]